MAMQFQLVGALSPALEAAFAISTVEIGIAIGLYFAPGLVIAIPGGAIARRFGEARVAAVGLWLMVAGGLLMGTAGLWSVFLVGQVIAGTGGVIINVLMTKMVADSFRDGDLALALSIFLNSWPLGIALSLVVLPPTAAQFGLTAAILGVAILAALFGILLPRFYRANSAGGPALSGWLGRRDLSLALSSGMVWGGFNAGVGVVFSFGTALLTDTGLTAEAASRQTSLVLWALALAAPLGGWLADRLNRPAGQIAAGVIGLGLLTVFAGLQGGHWMLLILIGLFAALVAGPAMSLPAQNLSDQGKAAGMGVFFTVYYAAFLLAPPLAGWVADAMNSVTGAFLVGALMQLAALAGLVTFSRLRRVPA